MAGVAGGRTVGAVEGTVVAAALVLVPREWLHIDAAWTGVTHLACTCVSTSACSLFATMLGGC